MEIDVVTDKKQTKPTYIDRRSALPVIYMWVCLFIRFRKR